MPSPRCSLPVIAGLVACTAQQPTEASPLPAAPPSPTVRLPVVATREPVADAGARVFVQPGALSVETRRIASVDGAGVVDAKHHRVQPLELLLSGGDPTAPVVVFADEAAPYGAVIDVLYTAARMGRGALQVAVAGEGAPGAIAVHGAETWDPGMDRWHGEPMCLTHVEVGDAEVRVRPCAGDWTSIPLGDRAAQSRFGASMVAGRLDRVLAVQAAPTVSWGSVAATIDALAAAPCGDPDPDEALDPESRAGRCRPWEVILDLDPPLPWYPGDWSALALSIYEIDPDTWADRPSRYTEAKLRARVERALPELQTCLRDAPETQLRMPRCVEVMLARERGREVSIIDLPEVPYCAGEIFAPLAADPWRLVPGEASFRLQVDFPGDDAPTNDGRGAPRPGCLPLPAAL